MKKVCVGTGKEKCGQNLWGASEYMGSVEEKGPVKKSGVLEKPVNKGRVQA